MPNIVETAAAAGSLNTLVAAVKAAGLVDTLSGPGPFTVFAPTDEAFAKLPDATIESLMEPEGKEKLIQVLTYHVAPKELTSADVVGLSSVETVQGGSLSIGVADKVTVDDANVIQPDIECDNGVIHVIDTVVLPK